MAGLILVACLGTAAATAILWTLAYLTEGRLDVDWPDED